MITKLEIYAISALLLAAAVAGAYFYAKHQGVMEERGRWEVKAAAATKADLESLTQAVATGNKIAQETQTAVTNIKVTHTTTKGVIEREIRTDVRYANDCFPESGRLQWNAISAGNPVVPTGGAVVQPAAGLPQGNGPAGGGQQRRLAPPKP